MIKTAPSNLIAGVAVVLAALPPVAMADSDNGLAFADEVDTCVAAVDRHLDLDNVDRVRHFVVNTKQSGIGYVLTIETSVFSGATEKRYAAYCVAKGNNEPVKFRIDEVET